MKDNFIFYHSFRDTIMKSPNKDERNELVWYLIDCALGIIDVNDVPYPHNMVIDQMMITVGRSQSRYEKAVESGKKGGRPSVWIDPEEANRLYAELGSWDAVAEKMNVHRDTLRRARYAWSHQTQKNAEKPKNLSISNSTSESISKSVSISDSVSKSESDNRNNKENKNRANGATDAKASPRVSERKLVERKIQPSKEETIALLRSLREEREKERRENEDRREGGTG